MREGLHSKLGYIVLITIFVFFILTPIFAGFVVSKTLVDNGHVVSQVFFGDLIVDWFRYFIPLFSLVFVMISDVWSEKKNV